MISNLSNIANYVRQADYLIILAGAGMGKDSGLPDFRGENGFWNNYKAFRNRF